MRHTWFVSFCTVVATGGCLGATAPDCIDTTGPGGIGGVYGYTAADAGGAVLVNGNLVVTAGSPPAFTGSWNTYWGTTADTTALVGPQIGQGTFTANVQDGRVVIAMNPQNVDNNVELNGCYTNDGIRGTWHFITIAGERASGAFTLHQLLVY